MPSGPSLWEKPRPPQTALPDSVQAAMRWRRYCNAKESPCVLCAAHLRFPYEVGEFLAGFVALLGRFLPRLGPHGSPRGPFYFRPPATGWSPRDTWPTTPSAPDLRRPKALACQSFCQPDGNRSVASQYISMRDGIAIRPPRAAPAARARLRTPWLPSPPACASACRSPCSW
jgi:hypothetical protein